MMSFIAKFKSSARSDNEIYDEIWDEIWRRSEVRSLDGSSFSVLVQAGTVTLVGHLSMEYNRRLIEQICLSVSGVFAVRNRLVVDHDLQLEVAQALAKDERTRPFVFLVGCSHGWVSVAGQVPDRELQLIAEEVAASVPTVRGVIALPTIVGGPTPATVGAVQPHIAAHVYDQNGEVGEVGIVTQIVIQPRNRLVTHAVVLGNMGLADGTRRGTDYLVPVEAMQWVSPTSVFLKRHGPLLGSFPVFCAADYPLAPSTWQPPYPYRDSCVRWPQNEARELAAPAMALATESAA